MRKVLTLLFILTQVLVGCEYERSIKGQTALEAQSSSLSCKSVQKAVKNAKLASARMNFDIEQILELVTQIQTPLNELRIHNYLADLQLQSQTIKKVITPDLNVESIGLVHQWELSNQELAEAGSYSIESYELMLGDAKLPDIGRVDVVQDQAKTVVKALRTVTPIEACLARGAIVVVVRGHVTNKEGTKPFKWRLFASRDL